LIAWSLVRRAESPDDEPRFAMLETIREFGLEQLESSGEGDRIRRIHAGHMLVVAERAEPELTGPDQAAWLTRLELEHDNLRAALTWLLAHDQPAAVRLAGALWRFWWTRGHLGEGRRWLAAAVATNAGSLAKRAKALYGVGSLAGEQGDYADATTQLQAALATFRQIGDLAGEALTLTDLGFIARDQGDLVRAAEFHAAALALRRAASDRRGVAISLSNLVGLAIVRGEYDRAEADLAEAAETFRVLADQRSLATVMSMRADTAVRRGDVAAAVRHAEEALGLLRPVGDQASIAMLILTLATSLRAQGMVAEATDRFEEALSLFRTLGHQRGSAATLSELAAIAIDGGEIERALALLGQSLDVLGPTGDRYLLVGALEVTARAALACGDPVRSARLLGAARSQREAIGAPRSPSTEAAHEHLFAALRSTLGKTTFAETWDGGASLTLDQALAEARALRSEVATARQESLPIPAASEEPPGAIGSDLTPREREVLRLLVEGRTDREIAAALFVTTKTASNHVSSILSKLGVETRTAAAAQALRLGLA
jgi:ATP/maltotriose-dependent transcriptional regulator MalT